MDFLSIALIGAVVWIAILAVAVAMCRAAAQADAVHERRVDQARAEAHDSMRAALN